MGILLLTSGPPNAPSVPCMSLSANKKNAQLRWVLKSYKGLNIVSCTTQAAVFAFHNK